MRHLGNGQPYTTVVTWLLHSCICQTQSADKRIMQIKSICAAAHGQSAHRFFRNHLLTCTLSNAKRMPLSRKNRQPESGGSTTCAFGRLYSRRSPVAQHLPCSWVSSRSGRVASFTLTRLKCGLPLERGATNNIQVVIGRTPA